MKIYIKISLIVAITASLVGCNSFLEPEKENLRTIDEVLERHSYAEGLLIQAYLGLPTNHKSFTDAMACDEAVANDESKDGAVMSSGGWTSSNDPLKAWNDAYNSILYLNMFLDIVNDVEWQRDEEGDSVFTSKLTGEAYALRAWYYTDLLKKHGGIGESNSLLGVPIIKEVLTPNSDYQLPRNTYKECIDFIIEDCDSAIAKLPDSWSNEGGGNAFAGPRNVNRINANVAKLIKSRVLLTAASPAFSESGVTYEEAAKAANEIVNVKGIPAAANAGEITFYRGYTSDNGEVFWFSALRSLNNTAGNNENNLAWEKYNYPPSLYGDGLTNPTADLVNKFGLASGEPLPSNWYDTATNPYAGRDSRLAAYIVTDGSSMGTRTVNIFTDADNQVGAKKGSKTSYYLRKYMDEDVDMDPATPEVTAQHYYTYARYTEVMLNYAEALNEWQGPTTAPSGFTYSARDVINAIRLRAGIDNTYVNGITWTKDSFREFIRDERAKELCFEGFRFWDLRRWMTLETSPNESLIDVTVSGIKMNALGELEAIKEVERKSYPDNYKIYGPIPFDETLKYDIEPNIGWQ